MKDCTVDPSFVVRVVEVGEPVDLRLIGPESKELRPIECYVKPDGSLQNKASLCFVLRDNDSNFYIAQITKKMLVPVLRLLEEME